MDMNLGKLWEVVMEGEACRAADQELAKSWTWLSDWTELNWTELSSWGLQSSLSFVDLET